MAVNPTSSTGPQHGKAMLGSLRGNEYQLLLTLQTVLKAGILMKQDGDFGCNIAVEDQEAGKFDDVIFANIFEGVSNTLCVQAKNRMNGQQVTWDELFGKESKGAFSISKYFISFLELKKQRVNNKLDGEWLVLCTNVGLEDEVKDLVKECNLPEACDVFSALGATCYRFNRGEIESRKKYDFITKLLKSCSDSYNLVNLLVEIIYNEKELDLAANNPQRPNVALVSKYNKCLSSLVGTKRDKNTHEVQEHFISGTELTPNEKQFRKEFEDAYKTKSGIQDEIWDDVRAKGIKVKGKAKPKDEVYLNFPEDVISDDDIWMFFNHFIFATNADELPTRIKGILSRTNIIGKADKQLGSVEVETAFNYLHNIIKNWITQQSDLPAILKAEDVGKILQKCNLHLQHLKLKNISDEHVKTLNMFKGCIKVDWLKSTPLHKFLCSKEGSIHTFYSVYEDKIASSIVLEILKLYFENHHEVEVIFIEAMRHEELKNALWNVLRLDDSSLCLIIECKDKPFARQLEQQIITIFENSESSACNVVKKVILTAQIKTSDSSTEKLLLDNFVEGSLDRMLPEYRNMTMFGTHTLLKSVMQCRDDIATLLDLMQGNDRTLIQYSMTEEHYKLIQGWYVEREIQIYKLDFGFNTTVKYNGGLISGVFIIEELDEDQILDWKDFLRFFCLFEHNISNIEQLFDNKEKSVPLHHQTIEKHIYASDSKVHIFLDEAGFGKTTFLSWLGHYFQKTQTDWWVIRFNSIDYSTDFKHLSDEKQCNPIDDTRALKILYRMIHLALFVRNINHKEFRETDRHRELADQCASLMEICEGKLIVREEKLKLINLTPLQLITLRLFVHHCSQQTIVILFDGFDEVVPHYEKLVYDLLSRFERFDGIHKIFITSRPYNLRKEFTERFTNVAFYELIPFSDENIAETVHIFMKSRFKQYLENKNAKCLLEALTCTVKYYLGTISQVPLFIRMALDVLEPLIATNVDFVNGTIDKAFFDSLEVKFEELNLIETFVTSKIFKANVEKIQLPEAASNISGAISIIEILKKYKLETHSLLALCELFPNPEERARLQVDEKKVIEYMDEIKNGDENSGIIEAVVDDRPIFIQRTFADYFSARWFYQNKSAPKVRSFLKSFYFWELTRREVKNFFDRMLITESGRKPIHLAVFDIIEHPTVQDMLRSNPKLLAERDAGGRTTLHLLACLRNYGWLDCIDYTWTRMPNVRETFKNYVNAKDSLLQWTPLEYAMITFNEDTFCKFLTFGGIINTNELIDVILSHDDDPSIILCKTYKYGRFLAQERKLVKYIKEPLDEFQSELRRRVADFLIKKNIDLHCPIVDHGGMKLTPLEYYVSTNDRPMFHALVHRAGGLDKVVEKDVGPLILQAFASNSAHVLEFLICECHCDVPNTIDDVQLCSVLGESVVHSLNDLFNNLFKLYCSRKNLDYVESPPSDQDDDVGRLYKSFSFVYNFVGKEEMFNPPGIDTDILNLLHKSFKNSNINAAKFLMQLARIDINRLTYPFIVKSMEESKLKDMGVHWECEDNVIHLIDTMDDLHCTDSDGKTLLHIALENNCFHIVQHLIDEKEFPLHQADTINRWNAFHYCVMKQSTIDKGYRKIQHELETRRELFTYMMEKDPINCITSRDAAGRDLLHLAVINRHYSAANAMLKPILENYPEDERESVANSILSQSGVIGTARYNRTVVEPIDNGMYLIDGSI